MEKTTLTRPTTPTAQRLRPAQRLGVAWVGSIITHGLLLTWLTPMPRPLLDTPLMVTLADEPRHHHRPVSVRQPAPPRTATAATPVAPTSPPLPLLEISRDLLRAEAEQHRQKKAERNPSMPPSVMFDNLKDDRFAPIPDPPAALTRYTTAAGLLIYRRVDRDGKVSCMILRPADPNNEYDRGAIYLWNLDFDLKHAGRGGC